MRFIITILSFFLFLSAQSQPVADFSFQTNCAKHPVQFTNNSYVSTGEILWMIWDFGDGNFSNAFHPVHLYDVAGTYSVKLTVFDSDGGFASIQKNVQLQPQPIPEFEIIDNRLCADSTVHFVNTSNLASSYYWEFGDGDISANDSPNHVFENSGKYVVQLTAYNEWCHVTVNKELSIKSGPNLDFAVEDVCEQESYFFKNETPDIKNFNFQWSFGDGVTTNDASTWHTYTNEGKYSISLLGYTDDSLCHKEVKKEITIFPKPEAKFETQNICQFEQLTFEHEMDSSSKFLWTFGDGATSIDVFPVKDFINPGAYKIELIVENQFRCLDSTNQIVQVFQKPRVSFSVDKNKACQLDTISLANLSPEENLRFNWDFGNSQSSDLFEPKVAYSKDGEYLISLIGISSEGCSDTYKKEIEIFTKPVSGFIEGGGAYCSNDTIQLRLSGFKGEINHWEYSNDGMKWFLVESEDSIIQIQDRSLEDHFYRTKITGKYCSSVYSGLGQVSFIPLPFAGPIEGDSVICDGDRLELSAKEYQGNIQWFYRDINTTTWRQIDGNVKHISLLPYTSGELIYTASNNLCDSDTSEIFRYRLEPKINAGFIEGTTEICTKEEVMLSISGQNFDDIQWQFTNDLHGHWYSISDQKKSLQLDEISKDTFFRAIIQSRCNTDTTNTHKVSVSEYAPLEIIGPGKICSSEKQVLLINTSNEKVQWQHSNDQNQWDSISYDTSIKLTDSLNSGYFRTIRASDICPGDTSSLYFLKVVPNPYLQFSADSVCEGEFSQINIKVINENYFEDLEFQWKYKGQIISGEENFQKQFESGTHNISLDILADGLCLSQSVQQIKVNNSVKPSILSSNSCIGDSSRLKVSDNSFQSYQWYFSDTLFITDKNNISLLIQETGAFNAKVSVIDSNGCASSAVTEFTVNPKPEIEFSIQDSICYGENVFLPQKKSESVSYQLALNDKPIDYLTQLDTGLYQLGDNKIFIRAENQFECIVEKSIPFYVKELPKLTIKVEGKCVGDTTKLSLKTDNNLNHVEWNLGSGVKVAGLQAYRVFEKSGIYTISVQVEFENGCSISTDKEIEVYSKPEFLLEFPDEICQNKEYDFDFLVGEEVEYSFSTESDVDLDPESKRLSIQQPGISIIEVVLENMIGCITLDSREIKVNPEPKIDFYVDNVCEGDTATFKNLSEIKTGSISFNWDFGDGFSSIEYSPKKVYWNPDNYEVTLEGISNSGCSNKLLKHIKIHPLPIADFEMKDVCVGDTSYFFNTSKFEDRSSFHWMVDNQNDSSFNLERVLQSAGEHLIKLIVETDVGCKDSLYKYHKVVSAPDVKIQGPKEREINLGNSIQLEADGAQNYTWSSAELLDYSFISNPIITPDTSMVIIVYGWDMEGCLASDSIHIEVNRNQNVLATKFFSPNNDGINDTWEIENIENYQEALITVFDRNGRSVFSKRAYNNDWNGTYGNDLLPDGTYFYTIEFNDDSFYTGALTILRGE